MFVFLPTLEQDEILPAEDRWETAKERFQE